MLKTQMFLFFMQWRPLVLPDTYIDHGSLGDQMALAGFTPSHIAAKSIQHYWTN